MRGVLPPSGWEPGREEPYEPACAKTYFAHAAASEADETYFRLESDVRKVRLQAGELPTFEVKDLAGNTWTPAALKGRVTILQFWSPG